MATTSSGSARTAPKGKATPPRNASGGRSHVAHADDPVDPRGDRRTRWSSERSSTSAVTLSATVGGGGNDIGRVDGTPATIVEHPDARSLITARSGHSMLDRVPHPRRPDRDDREPGPDDRRGHGLVERLADDATRRRDPRPTSASSTRPGWSAPTACPTRCSPTRSRPAPAGLRAIIAGAGGAAHLPGMLAAKTTVPVLGVPVASSRHLSGQDSLLSIVQMPAGIPTATFAIGDAGATNAALFAVAMLAADDDGLRDQLDRYRAERRETAAASVAAATDMTSARRPIVPPATIGMLGGGQLGKYALDGRERDGLPDDRRRPRSARAGRRRRRRAPRRRVRRPGRARRDSPPTCSVVTTEFENAPAEALDRLADDDPGRTRRRRGRRGPGPDRGEDVPRRPRHRRRTPVAASLPTSTRRSCERARELAASGAVVKTAQFGYDGKGQRRCRAAADARRRARRSRRQRLHRRGAARTPHRGQRRRRTHAPTARSRAGRSTENVHVDGILDVSVAPARVDAALAARATELAGAVADRTRLRRGARRRDVRGR